jgi:hypothetical protein
MGFRDSSVMKIEVSDVARLKGTNWNNLEDVQ